MGGARKERGPTSIPGRGGGGEHHSSQGNYLVRLRLEVVVVVAM